MNTPAHLILNAAALGRGRLRDETRWILLGAVAPDLGMFVFFAWQVGVLGTSQTQIWNVEYFRPDWQLFFDLANSIPLAALGLAIAWRLQSTRATAFFASVCLHCAIDLALHHDDGHRHFLPLTGWRFASPISYWDPRHYGWLGALLEVCTVALGSLSLARRFPRIGPRALLAAITALYLALYTWAYVV